jgi:putative FmdB family regulatory protein
MPIYEFYCCDCHRIFNFLARRVDTSQRPDCPRCRRKGLERKISRFGISTGRKEADADTEGLPPGFDEAKFERAMEGLARESAGVNEDDPRQAAQLMRKLYQSTGMRLGEQMEEALGRMESGEDPDKIEAEMGDLMDDENALFGAPGNRLRGMPERLRPPQVDERLYDLPDA